MSIPVLMMGDPGRLPFVGHFRIASQCGTNTSLSAAGRVRPRDVAAAYAAARQIEGSLKAVDGDDVRVVLAACWDRIADIEGAALLCQHGDTIGVITKGLSALWAVAGGQIHQALPPGHPRLVGDPTPLVLERPVDALIAAPLGMQGSPSADYLAQCGVRR